MVPGLDLTLVIKRKISEWISREMFTYFPFLTTSASNRGKIEVAKW